MEPLKTLRRSLSVRLASSSAESPMLDDIDPLALASIFWNLIKNTEPEGLKNTRRLALRRMICLLLGLRRRRRQIWIQETWVHWLGKRVGLTAMRYRFHVLGIKHNEWFGRSYVRICLLFGSVCVILFYFSFFYANQLLIRFKTFAIIPNFYQFDFQLF